MTYFAEFLIDKGLVSPEDLLTSLIKERESSPTISKIVNEHNLLSTKDHLSVLTKQAKDKSSFKQAAQDLGLWNDDIETKVNAESEKQSRSFLNHLVDNELLPFEKITAAMDDFIAAVEDEEVTLDSSTPEETTSEETTTTDTANLPQIEFTHMDEGLLAEYLSLVTQETITDLSKDLSSLSSGDEILLESLEDQINAIRAGANFVGANLSSYLLGIVAEVLGQIRIMGMASIEESVPSQLIRLVDNVFSIAQHLKDKPDESDIWSDESFRQSVSENIRIDLLNNNSQNVA